MLFSYITDKKRWSWQGAVALTMALGIFLVDSIFYIGVAIRLAHGIFPGQPTILVLTAATSVLIGATASFLGRLPANAQRGRDARPR